MAEINVVDAEPIMYDGFDAETGCYVVFRATQEQVKDGRVTIERESVRKVRPHRAGQPRMANV